jgi:predicted PurR-regulated permease PerM
MQNWYQKFTKTAQAPTAPTVTDDTAMKERMNIVTNQLKNEIFPKFANIIGQTTYNEVNSIINQQIDNFARELPDMLQLENYNLEPMKNILRALASISAGKVLQEKNPAAWNFVSQDQNIVQSYITEFFRTVYSPSPSELESLKLTMQKK